MRRYDTAIPFCTRSVHNYAIIYQRMYADRTKRNNAAANGADAAYAKLHKRWIRVSFNASCIDTITVGQWFHFLVWRRDL